MMKSSFLHDKEKPYRYSFRVRCSGGVGLFTNNGSGVNDPNNPYLVLTRSRSYREGVYTPSEM